MEKRAKRVVVVLSMERIKVFDSRQNKISVVDKIRKTDAEWKNILTSDQYQVTTDKGTERPFTCTFDEVKGPGIYRSEVFTGTTGHAEAVQLTFDPQKISFREILQIFFGVHDPTTLNRQGADVGAQYRSVVFYNDEKQKTIAEAVMQELNAAHVWKSPVVTELMPLKEFYTSHIL